MSPRYRHSRPRGLRRVVPALRGRRGADLRPLILVAALSVLVAGAAVLALAPSSPLSTTVDTDQQAAGPSAEPDASAAPTDVDSAPDETPATDAPRSTAVPPSTEPDVSVLGAEVSGEPAELAITVVPAVRDLQVDIEGQRYSSDAEGRITANVSSPSAEVAVVGYQVTPAVQRVEFSRWGDGSTAASRTIDVDGQDTQMDLGVELSYRITVETDERDPIGPVVLRNGDETLEVEPGSVPWLPALSAAPAADGGLEAEVIAYDVLFDGQEVPASPYAPTPEGLLSVA